MSGRTEDVTLKTASDNRKIIMWFALATLLIAFIVLLSFQSFRAIESSAGLRMQSFELISKADVLQSELADAETSKRGYLLTGDLTYLQPYFEVRNNISAHMSELRQRTKDNEALKHLDVMAPLIDAKLAELIQTIELRRNGDAIGALAVVTKGHGKVFMDDIRAEMQSYKDRQRKILLERDAKFHSKMRSLLYAIVATSLVILLFSIVFIYLIYQRTQQKLKDIIHHETQQLLEIQEQSNKKLNEANDVLVISEEKLSVTLNSIGDAVIATDAAGCIAFLNPQAERFTGWSLSEAINRPIDEIFRIISKNTRLPATIPVADALAYGTIQGLANHTILIARDGNEIDIADSCAPIRNREGNVVGAVLVFRNVSGEYAAQKSLLDSAAELQRVNAKLKAWDQALNSFAIVAETDTRGKIIYANDLFCKISQYSREELLGSDHRDLVNSGYHSKEFWKEMWSTISQGESWQNEVMNHAKDGSDYWVDSIIVPLMGENQKPKSYLAFRFLITERKRLDHALQETNLALENARGMAEKANLAKSDFLSSMSHELRSPLNAILGFAQLLNSESPPPKPSQKASIEQILSAGWYLLELINEILDLAVIESRRMSMSAEPVSLAGVMYECQEMMEPQAHKRGITLAFAQLDESHFVHADIVRLKQILINLISNAIKYNTPGGNVDITCVQVEPGRVRICVKDSGEGLSPEELQQLFQPFNRLGKEGGPVEGTGIGLVMSKRLVELMGGVMGVESTVGVGSVFWFELASASAPLLTFPIADFNTPVKTTMLANDRFHTLLYIEDNPANLKLVEKLIARRPDMHLLTAIDAELGINLARNHQPELILMDINLPGISGIDALHILQHDPLTTHIPVLAISANAMPSDIRKGLEAGFCAYLTKPINVSEFMTALDAALTAADIQSQSSDV